MTVSSMPPVSMKINSGAFGVLYHDPRDATRCIKALKRPITGEPAASLRHLVDIVHWARPSHQEHLIRRFAWPVEVFGTADEINGYAMPLAPDMCFFELRVANKSTRSPLQLKYLMDHDYWNGPAIRSVAPSVSFQDRIEIALDCIDSVDILHDNGLCYGDVSSNNIVARLDRRPGAFFFDADSITTPEQRAEQPLVTPDWDTPVLGDPVAIDRSRVALLVFRLLAERPRARPDGNELGLLPVREGGQLAGVLAQTYVSGGAEAFSSLAGQLRSLRDTTRARRAMDEAVQSGFARVVLRDRPASLGVDDLHLLEQAKRHVAFEDQIDEAEGAQLRRLMRKAEYSGSPFTLDVRTRNVTPPPPSTTEQLHDLIADVRFRELAGHLSSVGLGGLEHDPWLPRAIEHAHVELDDVALQVAVRPGAGDLSFEWPRSSFVNLAEISVSAPDFAQTETVQRAAKSPRSTVSISAPGGTSGVATLRLGTIGTSGFTVMSPRSSEISLVIPASPTPSVSISQRAQGTRGSLGAAHTRAAPPLLFDPVRAAAEAEALAALRRRRRRRNAVLSAAAVLLLTAVGWSLWPGDTEFAPRSDLAVVVGSATYFLKVEDDDVSISWSGLPSDVVALDVSESSNGETWTPLPATTDPDTGASRVRITASPNEPLLLRMQPYTAQGGRPVYRAQASWLEGSGLQAQPFSDTRDPGWIDMSWVPVAEGLVPTSYEVRTAEGTGPWKVEPIEGTRFLRRPSPTERVFFAVRSVFADGTTGPWIEASTLPVTPVTSP